MTTNFGLAQTLMRESERCLAEAKRYFGEDDWNLTIRRAQESVELALKGLLRAGGWEVPKRYDVGALVIQQLLTCGLQVDLNTSDRIRQVSQILAEKRAPAFYWEATFERNEAEEALQDAEFVLAWSRAILTKLQGG